jgi:hypothetical protein
VQLYAVRSPGREGGAIHRCRIFASALGADLSDPRRTCIVATNVAETSITVLDAVYVIDGGLEMAKRDAPLLGQSQCTRLVNQFKPPGEDRVQVLVCSYLVSPAGYNMQDDCRFVHVFDQPSSEAAYT